MKSESRYTIERKKLGMSQEELALKIGISQKSISKYERGTSRPSFEALIAMSALFHCSIDYLLDNPNYIQSSTEHLISQDISYSNRAKELMTIYDSLSIDNQDIIMGKAKELLREQRLEKNTLFKTSSEDAG